MSQTALARIAPAEPELRQPLLEPQQWILLVVLLLEFVVFSFTGHNFLTLENAQQIPQQNVELGLLALAMTPVIVTGGIDLSVGSLLGLCAVLFGKLWRDAHMPIEFAAACAVVIGMIGGLINALLITRINIPPLIVTLGTYSLYRGIAEGITGGSDNFTNFPAAFLNFGNGWQLPILAVAAIAFITIAMMPKSKGNAYFIACQQGAEEAAKELGVKLCSGTARPIPTPPSRTRSSTPGSPAASMRSPCRSTIAMAFPPSCASPRGQGHQGDHLGRRRRPRCARFLRESGHARGHRRRADGRRRPRAWAARGISRSSPHR
jgi:hypothetical protein